MTGLLCLGDSITDCGRIWDNPPLGSGYVRLISQKLHNTGQHWHVTNRGVDGFTVARLLEYVRGNLGEIHADFITVLIGINDIGLMMNTGRTPVQQAQMMEKFFQNYEKLLLLLNKITPNLLLLEPFIFPCPARYSLWIPHVEEMSRGINALANQYDLPYIFLHKLLNEKAQADGINKLTIDGIHLTSQGHELIAQELLLCLQKNIAY